MSGKRRVRGAQWHSETNEARETLTRRHNNTKGTAGKVDVCCGRRAPHTPQQHLNYESDDAASTRVGGRTSSPFSCIQIPLGHGVCLVRDQVNNENSVSMSIKKTRVNTRIYSYIVEYFEIHTHT